MNTLSKFLSFVLLLTLCLIPTGLVSAAITDPPLDEFNDNQSLEITYSGTPVPGVNAVSGSMIGGERDIYATIFNGDLGQKLLVTVNDTNSSVLNITSGTSIQYTVSIQYDGNGDVDKEQIDTTGGLGGIDLTQGGTRDRFILAIPFTDLGAPVQIRVYSSSSQCTQRQVLPGSINNLKPKLFEFTLSITSGAAICSGYTGHASFTSVRAIEIFVNANNSTYASTDMVMDLITTVKPPYLDYGDLPDSYDLDYEVNPGNARHIVRGPKLGSNVTAENAKPTVDGGADEDSDDPGVVPLDKWQAGATEQVQVTVSNCSSTCYIDAWIDWSLDDNFWDDSELKWDADEHVLKSAAVSNGTQNLNITVPSWVTLANNSFYVRFRISDRNRGGLGTAWWFYYSGEVEDYLWSFGPNAVPVAKLLARAEQPSWTWGLAFFGLVLGAVLMFKRRLR